MFSNRVLLSSHLSKCQITIPGCTGLWERDHLAKEYVIARPQMIDSDHFSVCTNRFVIPLALKGDQSQKEKKKKRNKLLTHAITRMNLKNVMLSKALCQTQKAPYCLIQFMTF